MGVHDFLRTPYLLCSIALFCFASFGLAATAKLHSEEVKALGEIGRKLGKKNWDFGKDPCSGEGNWAGEYGLKGALKAQNLSGNVPSEFSKLHYLKILDLSRNYLNGTIPHEWTKMRSLSEL
ncbi:hypothetical protein FEM48_Zijuj04G0166900 [Ziziphus jujuba var. spinosa]|uniref:Uncharacterized protein n=1 Tax=Ziziphus jujuba var. spinosa TaxID=714518 RepID=A0A978VKZ9_ZIZJJ|nr:hypothetical protein FEM48_Zijuj04G0166900 [Ziziphus jujuba var. spinosa]